MDGLDDFLDAGAIPPEPDTSDVAQQPDGPARDEHGRFAPKADQETGVEPQETADEVPPTPDKLPAETFKGLKEEREKRQALERKLEALEAQFATPTEPPAPPPSMWEDEQGWQQHFGQQVATSASFNARLDMSEMLAAQNHDDFDAMKERFVSMMAQNPALQQQALGDRHPWEKAYQIAKNAARMEELGATNVADLETKLREQIKAELAAQQPQQQPALPASLADSQSARATTTGAPAMLSLDQILGA